MNGLNVVNSKCVRNKSVAMLFLYLTSVFADQILWLWWLQHGKSQGGSCTKIANCTSRPQADNSFRWRCAANRKYYSDSRDGAIAEGLPSAEQVGQCLMTEWYQVLPEAWTVHIWCLCLCGNDLRVSVMGKSKLWFDLNCDWITGDDLIWVQKIWFRNL